MSFLFWLSHILSVDSSIMPEQSYDIIKIDFSLFLCLLLQGEIGDVGKAGKIGPLVSSFHNSWMIFFSLT